MNKQKLLELKKEFNDPVVDKVIDEYIESNGYSIPRWYARVFRRIVGDDKILQAGGEDFLHSVFLHIDLANESL